MLRIRDTLAALDDVATVQQQGEIVAELDLSLIERLEVALLDRVLRVRGGGDLVPEAFRAVLQGDQPHRDPANLCCVGILDEGPVQCAHGLCAVDHADAGQLEVADLSRDGSADRLDRLAEHGDAVAKIPEVLRLLQQRVLDLDVDVGQVEGIPDIAGKDPRLCSPYRSARSGTVMVP